MKRKSIITIALFLILASTLAFASHSGSTVTKILGDTIETGDITANELNVEQVNVHAPNDFIDMSNNRLTDLEDPVDDQDVVNLRYLCSTPLGNNNPDC